MRCKLEQMSKALIKEKVKVQRLESTVKSGGTSVSITEYLNNVQSNANVQTLQRKRTTSGVGRVVSGEAITEIPAVSNGHNHVPHPSQHSRQSSFDRSSRHNSSRNRYNLGNSDQQQYQNIDCHRNRRQSYDSNATLTRDRSSSRPRAENEKHYWSKPLNNCGGQCNNGNIPNGHSFSINNAQDIKHVHHNGQIMSQNNGTPVLQNGYGSTRSCDNNVKSSGCTIPHHVFPQNSTIVPNPPSHLYNGLNPPPLPVKLSTLSRKRVNIPGLSIYSFSPCFIYLSFLLLPELQKI